MRINDLGFMFIKLTNDNVYTEYLNTVRDFIDNNPLNQIVIFNSYNEKINTNNISILHLSHGKFFYGDLILFDLASAMLTNSFPNIKKRYLYLNNIPWLDMPNNLYSSWREIFDSENLELIVPNQQLYDIYSICWKSPVGIAQNFTYQDVSKIICEDKKNAKV